MSLLGKCCDLSTRSAADTTDTGTGILERVTFPLSLVDQALSSRSDRWTNLAVAWSIERSPAYPKMSVHITCETDSAQGGFSVWDSGEAEYGSGV